MIPLKKYIWLVDTVMRAGEKGLTLEQIGAKWNADDEMHDEGTFAKRSFHRHRKEIADLFDIEIESYGNGHDFRYRIADSGGNNYLRQWLMNSIAVNRIVADSQEVAQYLALESYHDEALPVLMQALKEQRMVSFTYNPFWKEGSILYYNFKPHGLKMFERRWYLIGCFGSRKEHRIYALDRISNCELQEDTYRRDPKFNLEKMFDGVYGITLGEAISPSPESPPCREVTGSVQESVWLKVAPYQAHYLRSLPLHKSQHEIGERDGCPVFSLRVQPTFDLTQKLLSMGSSVEVLKPERLRKEMREEIKAMLSKYPEEDA